jgi:hypothetical protein
MAKRRTKVETAVGNLISAIKKEWGKEVDEPIAHESEEIIYKAHELLQASKNGNITRILNGASISELLSLTWVERRQAIKPVIMDIEIELQK